MVRKWTREALCVKAREWAEQYGEPPSYTDWDPTVLRNQAVRRSEEAQKAWERYARYQDGDWPSRMSVQKYFSSWMDLMRAAGLEAKYRRIRDYRKHWRHPQDGS